MNDRKNQKLRSGISLAYTLGQMDLNTACEALQPLMVSMPLYNAPKPVFRQTEATLYSDWVNYRSRMARWRYSNLAKSHLGMRKSQNKLSLKKSNETLIKQIEFAKEQLHTK